MAKQWSTVLVGLLTLLFSRTIAVPDPLLRAKLARVIESRELCYNDDILWSFQYWSHDSTPYCSSLLGIHDHIVTVNPVTSYTTTSTLVTTEYDDPTDTITIPQATVFLTTTTTVAHVWKNRQVKRQLNCSSGEDCAEFTDFGATTYNFSEVAIPFPPASPIAIIAPGPLPVPLNYSEPAPQNTTLPEPILIAPAPNPPLQSTNPGPTPITENPVPSILADSATNASIASYVFSACSCLRLKPKTVDFTPIVQTTRTISGIDYEAQPTVAGGTTTVLVIQTVLPSVGLSVSNSTIPGTNVPSASSSKPSFSGPGRGGQNGSQSFMSTGVNSPSQGIMTAILPIFPSSHSFRFPTGTGTVGTLVSFGPSSGSIPYPIGTGGPKTPSMLSSGTGVLNSRSSGISKLEDVSMSLSASHSSSLSFIAPPPMTAPLPLSSSTRVPPAFSISGASRDGFSISVSVPALLSNGINSDSLTNIATTSLIPPLKPSASVSISISTSSSVGLPNTPTTASTYTTINSFGTASPSSTMFPVGNSLGPAGCPSINNTIFTDNSTVPVQQYQLQCYRKYTGPSYLGLAESNFKNCIEECDKVNLGFSEMECFGVTWLQYSGGNDSVRCFLKTQQGLEAFMTETLAVSAVLLDVPPPIIGLFSPPPREVNGTWYPA